MMNKGDQLHRPPPKITQDKPPELHGNEEKFCLKNFENPKVPFCDRRLNTLILNEKMAKIVFF